MFGTRSPEFIWIPRRRGRHHTANEAIILCTRWAARRHGRDMTLVRPVAYASRDAAHAPVSCSGRPPAAWHISTFSFSPPERQFGEGIITTHDMRSRGVRRYQLRRVPACVCTSTGCRATPARRIPGRVLNASCPSRSKRPLEPQRPRLASPERLRVFLRKSTLPNARVTSTPFQL